MLCRQVRRQNAYHNQHEVLRSGVSVLRAGVVLLAAHTLYRLHQLYWPLFVALVEATMETYAQTDVPAAHRLAWSGLVICFVYRVCVLFRSTL